MTLTGSPFRCRILATIQTAVLLNVPISREAIHSPGLDGACVMG